jgi:hypothetical protein
MSRVGAVNKVDSVPVTEPTKLPIVPFQVMLAGVVTPATVTAGTTVTVPKHGAAVDEVGPA